MDVFEQEESSPQPGGEGETSLSVEVPEGGQPDAVSTLGRAADSSLSGDEPDSASVPSTPNGGALSAVDSVFDVEERTPRKQKKKIFVSVSG